MKGTRDARHLRMGANHKLSSVRVFRPKNPNLSADEASFGSHAKGFKPNVSSYCFGGLGHLICTFKKKVVMSLQLSFASPFLKVSF